jgi:hypothetical protein
MLKNRFDDYEELLNYSAELYFNLKESIDLAKNIKKSNDELIEMAKKNDNFVAEAKVALKEFEDIVKHDNNYAQKIECKFEELYKVTVNVLDELPSQVRKQTSSKGGKARAANDTRSKTLDEIEEIARSKKECFLKRGYQAKFIKSMLDTYPTIADEKSIEKRIKKIKEENHPGNN